VVSILHLVVEKSIHEAFRSKDVPEICISIRRPSLQLSSAVSSTPPKTRRLFNQPSAAAQLQIPTPTLRRILFRYPHASQVSKHAVSEIPSLPPPHFGPLHNTLKVTALIFVESSAIRLSTFLTLPSSLFIFLYSSRFPSSSLDHFISFHQALELDYRKWKVTSRSRRAECYLIEQHREIFSENFGI
jgi:hypothetical protein